jgi:hypothetical protein
MTGMGRTFLLLLLLAAAVRAEWTLQPYKCRPLEFEIGVPENWTSQQDHTGMVSSTRDAGFMVSREPFLHDVKTFGDAWAKDLGAAKIDTKVATAKVGRYAAWHASWKGAGRDIAVWRVYVPVNEMVYNFSFSAGPGVDLPGLREAVLKAFTCTSKGPTLKFERTAESVSTRVSIKPPQGYVKQERGVRLGGGLSGGFTKTLPGYAKPHQAGLLAFRAFDARITYALPDGGSVPGGDTKKLIAFVWGEVKGEIGAVVKRPRTKGARYAGMKGHAMEAQVLAKDGKPKVFFAFLGKHKTTVVSVSLLVDAREARLHKDLFKQVCNHIEVKK